VNAVLAAVAAALAASGFWLIAAAAARRRQLTIGAPPLLLAIVVTAVSIVGARNNAPAAAVLAAAGAVVAGVADLRTGFIFDPLTAAIACAVCALEAVNGTLAAGIAGVAAAGGTLLVLHRLTGGRGLGLGDVKLAAAVGAALGWSDGITALAYAFVLGGLYGVWLLATRRAGRGAAIRFGPFIAAGTCAAILTPAGFVP
jgi:leader peptidase (prepilin peptidase)/N-methyltransferase